EDFYAAQRIELSRGRTVVGLDLGSRHVQLEDGERLPYTAVVLATGAAVRRLDIPGATLDGVHYLRTLPDARRLGDAIRGARRVAVIGAGWIGSEVAASARQMGADVVLVDPLPVPLQRVLGDEIGGVFRDLHAEHGVHLRLGVGVSELRGPGAVQEVVLANGETEAADVVVIGVGVVPRVELASAAGLAVDDGIVVDQHLRTNTDGVYAAGDVAPAWHPHYRRRLRVEHWSNALEQGALAGRNAAGEGDTYAKLPYFFSDQYDLGMEYVGHSRPGDAVAVRGDLAGRE